MDDNPTLSREHIERIRSVAQMRSVRSGEVLYAPSHPDVPLFIVLEGTVSITRAGEDEKILAVREPGQFTGEMSVISGNRSLLTARVTSDGVVLELTRDKVLTLMAKDTEVGEILMGAFVARRLLMIQLGEGNVILFGTGDKTHVKENVDSILRPSLPPPIIERLHASFGHLTGVGLDLPGPFKA